MEMLVTGSNFCGGIGFSFFFLVCFLSFCQLYALRVMGWIGHYEQSLGSTVYISVVVTANTFYLSGLLYTYDSILPQ